MKSITIKVQGEYVVGKWGTGRDTVYISDAPIQNDLQLITAIYEAEQDITDTLDKIYDYQSKGRNKEMAKVINTVFETLATRIRNYRQIEKEKLTEYVTGRSYKAELYKELMGG